MKTVFWIAMAVITLVIVHPVAIMSIRSDLRNKRRNSTPTRSGAGIGNALQELDRLVARPSVEFTVVAETPILKREDDRGE